jgi:uncharacterized protein with ParB-like and HNH nuclease domain
MSYQGLSIKEAMNNINSQTNGWYLPTIQRPYVWGDRHESEKYICKLFDSVLKGYPIGNILVWNCATKVPYKEFSKDYYADVIVENTDESRWSQKDKWLVYDGQQRLQTLFSCLRYSINGRVLVNDLLFSEDTNDMDKVGFYFVDKNSSLPLPFGHIKMSELYTKSMDDKSEYRELIFERWAKHNLTRDEKRLIEKRLDKLFDVFVNKDYKVLAYYQLSQHFSEDQVNEVFQRINSGGVPLSGADLLFSRIKQEHFSFEEDTLRLAKTIKELTAGYDLSHYFILLIINVIIKKTTRIDATKVRKDEISRYKTVFDNLKTPIQDFFQQFIFNTYKINNVSIIVRGNALIPLIIYVYYRSENGIKYKDIETDNLNKMKTYFVLSQLNDWNTQTIISKNSELAQSINLPLNEMIKIASDNGRVAELSTNTLEYYRKFSLKVIFKNRLLTNTGIDGRYNPELDHIYPVKLDNRPVGYNVDVLWNLQPIDGKTNLDKLNQNPLEYFKTKPIEKSKYDYIDNIGNYDWLEFIKDRKIQMIEQFENEFNIKLAEKETSEITIVQENLSDMKFLSDKLVDLELKFPSKNSIDIKLSNGTSNVIFIWKLDDCYRYGIWMNRTRNSIDSLKNGILKIADFKWFTEYKSAIIADCLFTDKTSQNVASDIVVENVRKLYLLVNSKI